MNETIKNEVLETEVVMVEDGWLTKFGRKLDEKKAARRAKKAAMTPEEQKKKFWTKVGVGVAGVVAVGVAAASMMAGGGEVDELPEGQDYDDDETPFEAESITESVE